MFCPKCGSNIPDNASFCGQCGAQLQRSAAVSPQPVPSPASAPVGEAVARKPISKQVVAIAAIVIVLLIGLAVFFVVGGCGGSGVTPKSSVNEYTWEELSKISAEIGRKTNEDAAVNVAKKYNLVNAEGKLDGTQTKNIQFTNGTQAVVQIAGFSHDDKTGGGKAGITFIFKDVIAEHDMNSSDNNSGGWEGSPMRSWLATDGLAMLPQDLSSKIVAVDKKTNNAGETESVASVSTTSDKLWLYSFVELAGEANAYEYHIDSSHSMHDDILDSEGAQYKLFRDCSVDPFGSNGILSKKYDDEPHDWWERTPSPHTAYRFFYVDSYGEPDDGYFASYVDGVVPGFCI